MHTFDIIVPLDLCVDLIADLGGVVPRFGQVEQEIAGYQMELGGSAVIFAVQAAKLGLRVAGVGRVGDDLLGHFVLEKLKASGVNTDWVVMDSTIKTGLGIALSQENDRAILTYTGSIDGVMPADLFLERVASARHLHIGSYFLMKRLQAVYPTLLPEVRRQEISISLDSNWDPEECWESGIQKLLPYVSVFLPNQLEAQYIAHADDIETALNSLRRCTAVIAVKNGAQGAAVYSGDQTFSRPAISVTVCDAIGAGDNFDAGFVYGYLHGFFLDRCLEAGIWTGGKSTESAGGIAGQINEATLLSLLDSTACI